MKLKITVAVFLLLSLSACNGEKSGVKTEQTSAPAVEKPVGGAVPPVVGTAETPKSETAVQPSDSKPESIRFIDVTREAGIKFKHANGAFGEKYLPETMGSGCAFLDYDGDGRQDILLVNSTNWPGHKSGKTIPALYRNNGDGTFSDMTNSSGLAVEMYGLGCAVGDYDNDGRADIFISCLGPDYLFHNRGNGKFEDASKRAGLDNPDFSTSAAWVDYDKDGLLDLFVCNYVEWSIDKDLFCTLDGTAKSYCKPDSYKGQTSRLYRNNGKGAFEDATQRAGLFDPTSKALGVAVLDYNRDDWPDLFTANDTEPNKLYRNNKDGTFAEEGVASGIAFNEAGVARAGMGVDFADYDGSGYPSLIIGNFSNEMLGLYHNEGTGLFIDEAPSSNVGQSTLLSLTFSCFFLDYDLDGREDIFLANGHVADDINRVQPKITYAQPPKMFRNIGKKRFEEASRSLGDSFQKAMVARGAAYGDYDGDGDLDLLVTTNNGPARLFRNDGANQNNLVRIKTVGTKSNRDGIGAAIIMTPADGGKQWRVVKSGSSYCSQSELPVTFGLGKQERIASIEVKWPSGTVDKLTDIAVNQILMIKEGKGLAESAPLKN